MSEVIRVGSIIHLESIDSKNGTKFGGFLNQLDWVTNISVITKYHDPHVRALVTTDEKTNRTGGSGSWQILSADPEKKLGDELKDGNKIHLLNMHPSVGYLDTFEWVTNLEPFKDYPMTIGVFTSNVPNRGGGVSGTWTISLDPKQPSVETDGVTPKLIKVSDIVYLKNEYPGAGFLSTYTVNSQTVPDHSDMFNAYTGAMKFVFTGPSERHEEKGSSYAWKITLVGFVESLYRVENQWGNNNDAPWHEAGIFKIGDGQYGRVVALDIERKTSSDIVWGVAQFEKDQTKYSFEIKATIKKGYLNRYDVYTRSVETITLDDPNNVQPKEGEGWSEADEWLLGSREFQKITHLKIKDSGGNGPLIGTIQYETEDTIRFRASQGAESADRNEILYDFFHPDLLSGRAQKMQGVIDTTNNLLSNVIEEFEGVTQQDVDFDFQKEQLNNLRLLSQTLNAFYRYKLTYLMKQSFKNHQTDQPLAPLYLIRQCFQGVATDHEIIQQATVQRRWTHGVKGNPRFISELAVELLITDKLAMKAIAPFKHLLTKSNDQNDLAIITYLSEETHIRRLPYTDQLIVIGVSYDRVPQASSLFDNKVFIEKPFHAFELMAIPHEIGHYIYAHGKLPDGRTFPEVCKQFAGNNPYYRWSEEIFADLYGCIVTGPLTVLSMLALLVSIDRERVWKDDEEHPTPVLRLFILNEILQVLKDIDSRYDFSAVTEKLDEEWTRILESWGYAQVGQENKQTSKRPARIYLHDNSAIHLEQIVNIDRVINAIKPIIVEFATQLLYKEKDSKTDPFSFDIPWVKGIEKKSGDSEGMNTLDEKLKHYNETMKNMTNRTFAGGEALFKMKFDVEIDQKKPDMSDPDNPKKSLPPNELLRHYLANWGDSGPMGGSGGTHFG